MSSIADPLQASVDPWALAALLAPPGEASIGAMLPDLETFTRWADECAAQHHATRPAPFDELADQSPRAFLWWTLRMAVHTYGRLLTRPPPVDSDLLAGFRRLLEDRPPEDPSHAQFHIDPASSLRRAIAIQTHLQTHPGPVLAIGDDDATTLALALLGERELGVVDIDPRLLDYLNATVVGLGARLDVTELDLFEAEIPERYFGRFVAVVADPPRSYDEARAFLQVGAFCMRRDASSRLFWADHPDWNFEYEAVVAELPRLGLRGVETLPDLHAYPSSSAWLPDPESKARELGVDAGWLSALVACVRGWTHLHVLGLRRP